MCTYGTEWLRDLIKVVDDNPIGIQAASKTLRD